MVIEGYASRFGVRDLNDDVVAKGAFLETLKHGGARGVRMLYQHQAKAPVGVWDVVVEDVRNSPSVIASGDATFPVNGEGKGR